MLKTTRTLSCWRMRPSPGIAAWSLNRFTFFEAVDRTAELGLHDIEAFEGQRLSQENDVIMYGKTDAADFSHVVGYRNDGVEILFCWSAARKLTGLVGCGGRGTGAAGDALTGDPGTTLWAAADVFPDQIEASLNTLTPMFPDRIQVPRERQFAGLNGYRGVIENCDLVLIACASRFHAEYALAGVQARKHVFVEKPAAVDVAGIEKILQADELSRKNGTGVLSGDDVPQSLIHDLDSALWALGDVMPERAYGMGGRSTHFQASMGTSFDHHQVTYEYADGRCIYGSCRTASGCFGLNRDVFHGTKGRCHFAAFDRPYFTDLKGKVTWRADAASSKKSPYEQEHLEFLQSIRAGEPFQRAKVLADSTMATVLGQMAVYSGQRLTWKEALESKFAFPPPGEITMNTEPPVKPGAEGIYPVAVPGQTKLV